MYKAFNVSTVSDLKKSTKQPLLTQTFKLTPVYLYDNQSLVLAYVSKINKSLGFLTSHYNIVPTKHFGSNPSLNKIYSLMPDVVTNSIASNVRFQIKEVNSQVSLYTLTSLLQGN
jgi:hypothetical protein